MNRDEFFMDFKVFGCLFVVIRAFFQYERALFERQLVEWVELIEFYLESR